MNSSEDEDKEVLSSVLRKPQTLGGSKVVNYAPKEFKGIVGFKRFLQSTILQIEYVRDKNVLGGFYILIKLPDKQALEEVKSPESPQTLPAVDRERWRNKKNESSG